DDSRGGRRRRRDRRGGDLESPADAGTGAPGARVSDDIAASESAGELGSVAAVAAGAAVSHDAVTRPVAVAAHAPEGAEAGEPRGVPDDAESGWDLGDEDPTAAPEPADKPGVSTPSSTEMAGDGAVEGEGLDTGWD